MTLRSLLAMAEGRREHEWNQTALIVAIIAESHRDAKQRSTPFTVDDFHPMRQSANDEEEWDHDDDEAVKRRQEQVRRQLSGII